MTNWEPLYPPRTSSRFQAPGIFVNFEFGVSFSPNDGPHTASLHYTSSNMQDRLNLQQQDRYSRRNQHPSLLVPGNPRHPEWQTRHQQEQQQQRTLGIRAREVRERGSSAPPTMSDRLHPISPVSPIGTIYHTTRSSTQGSERPLPPLPSRFRLGDDELPWSTEPWYSDPEPEIHSPATVDIELEERRGEDPQRVRDLGALHHAMMTVDSLSHDGWEPWTWDTVGGMPRGPRSLGWAVRSSEPADVPVSSPPPPPYVVSQWEEAFGNLRPRSSG